MTFSINKQLSENLNTPFQPIDSDLLNLISVTPPYFALQDLRLHHTEIWADFKTEMIDQEEFMPITTSELGRHMAILGSIALAKYNPKKEKHYYLAIKADIKRLNGFETENLNLCGSVSVAHCSRKEGKVTGFLYDTEYQKLAEVEIYYMILHHRVFDRLFAQHKVEFEGRSIYNPYTQMMDFDKMAISRDVCIAKLEEIKKEHCVGHFNHIPAMPIARLGFAMGKLGGKHFLQLFHHRKKYMVLKTRIEAKRLVFPGEELTLKSRISSTPMENGIEIIIEVFSNKGDMVASSITNYV